MNEIRIIFKCALVINGSIESIGITIENSHERFTKTNLVKRIKSFEKEDNEITLVTKNGTKISMINDKYFRTDDLQINEDELSELSSC